jgi:hypothetical protein
VVNPENDLSSSIIYCYHSAVGFTEYVTSVARAFFSWELSDQVAVLCTSDYTERGTEYLALVVFDESSCPCMFDCNAKSEDLCAEDEDFGCQSG